MCDRPDMTSAVNRGRQAIKNSNKETKYYFVCMCAHLRFADPFRVRSFFKGDVLSDFWPVRLAQLVARPS